MRKNLVWYILIVSLVILSLMIANLLNINYIKQENNQVEVLGEKVLLLKDKQNEVSIPHLNLKGTIKYTNSSRIDIELSEYAVEREVTQAVIHPAHIPLEIEAESAAEGGL